MPGTQDQKLSVTLSPGLRSDRPGGGATPVPQPASRPVPARAVAAPPASTDRRVIALGDPILAPFGAYRRGMAPSITRV
ncbi:hypothetical protein NUM_21590 [Actinocatenispora comari]|uniref:Uncharacterized protein n=1 Tax=Actinocatenispora comari TaxID=2807577 RepID=A0A8J4EKB4_9ACTN|nr:hypothetical protein NUM_21590 [Actinocatenispora comari]